MLADLSRQRDAGHTDHNRKLGTTGDVAVACGQRTSAAKDRRPRLKYFVIVWPSGRCLPKTSQDLLLVRQNLGLIPLDTLLVPENHPLIRKDRPLVGEDLFLVGNGRVSHSFSFRRVVGVA